MSDLRWILPAIAGAVVILAAIVGFFTWYFTRFIIDDEELRIETGAIFKNSKKIPFERLQSVDIIQPSCRADLRSRRATAGGRSRRQHHQAALPEPVQGEPAPGLPADPGPRAIGPASATWTKERPASAFTDLGTTDRPLVTVPPQRSDRSVSCSPRSG